MTNRAPDIAAAILEHPSGLMDGLLTAFFGQSMKNRADAEQFSRGCAIAAELAVADGRVDANGDEIPAASRVHDVHSAHTHACARTRPAP